jgi:hypothetical protein
MNIYVCATQFHLATVMLMVTDKGKTEENFLILDAHRESIKNFFMTNELYLNEIFSGIYIYDIEMPTHRNKNRLVNFLHSYSEFRLIKHKLKLILYKIIFQKKHVIYFCTGPQSSKIIDVIYTLTRKTALSINVIEDGISTYLYKRKQYTLTKIINKTIKFLYRINTFNYLDADKIFLHDKNFYYGEKTIVSKIYNIDIDYTSLKEKFNVRFLNEKTINFIYFSQNFIEKENEINILNKISSGLKYFYKVHPSVLNIQNTADYDTIPWELYSSNISEDVAFATISSTAVLTPFLLYGKKNSVIFLYKLLKIELFDELIDFLNEIKTKYPEIIKIPSTVSEFTELFNKNEKEYL